MLAGAYSLISAIIFVSLDAVDVAFTEAAVGAGLSTVLYIAAMKHLPKKENVVKKVNNSKIHVISIDIPSGINATSGDVCGLAVNADRTVTMGFLKLGLVIQPGKSLAGEVEIADLGYPEEVYNGLGDNKNFIDESLIDDCIKSPKINTYKHKQGKLLLLAGSRGFTGAAILAGNAAMRSGAGLVLSIIPESINVWAILYHFAMLIPKL